MQLGIWNKLLKRNWFPQRKESSHWITTIATTCWKPKGSYPSLPNQVNPSLIYMYTLGAIFPERGVGVSCLFPFCLFLDKNLIMPICIWVGGGEGRKARGSEQFRVEVVVYWIDIPVPRSVWQSSYMVLRLELTSLINSRKLQMHYWTY